MATAIKDMFTRLITSTKWNVTVAAQVVLLLQWFFTKLPAGLEGLDLEQAQYDSLQAYVARAVVVLCMWLGSAGLADFGKAAKLIEVEGNLK